MAGDGRFEYTQKKKKKFLGAPPPKEVNCLVNYHVTQVITKVVIPIQVIRNRRTTQLPWQTRNILHFPSAQMVRESENNDVQPAGLT